MNVTRTEAVVSLLSNERSLSEVAQAYGVSEAEVVQWKELFLQGARAGAQRGAAPGLTRRAGLRGGLLAALVVLGLSAVALGQLKTFVANSPAVASDINANFALLDANATTNFTQLKGWLEQKVGTAGNPEVRVQTGTTSNASTASGKAVFASANTASNTASILEVRHDNLSQGVGLGYNSVNATGTNANQDLYFNARGTGALYFNVNKASLDSSGNFGANGNGTFQGALYANSVKNRGSSVTWDVYACDNGGSSASCCASGYSTASGDLNAGAGGHFIYLCVRKAD